MDWTTWKPATCLPDNCWCEAARVGKLILEPVNTWSNLGFILLGIYFLINAQKFVLNQNILSSSSTYSRIYGFALLFVGLGSFFYHASQTFIGQWFDVFGMYLVSVFYICYNLLRAKKIKELQFKYYYLGICIFLGLVLVYIPQIRRELFGVTIIIAVIQSVWLAKRSTTTIKTKYLIGSVVSYLTAQTIWLLDKNKIWCDPYGWINGHGIWHILCAFAAILIYLYFQSEEQHSPVA